MTLYLTLVSHTYITVKLEEPVSVENKFGTN